MMARPNLTLEEAEELAHFGIPMASDVRMPSGWHLSVDGVPVAPVPEAGTHLFARAVGLYRAQLSAEELQNPLYAPNNPAWPDTLAADRDACLHAFAGPRPPVKHNRARHHQLWDGRSFEEVVAPHRTQAAAGSIPAPINADFAAFRLARLHRSRS
ncbi:hypothetical protein D1007_07160 [Hordeum vulgare]|nr:hypothetical protein D1007_07160 [Hordeum vulgare]